MATVMDLQVKPVSTAVGAIIEGLELAKPMDPAQVAQIRKVLTERGVVFFPAQGLTMQQMWDFVAHFGTPWADDSFGSDEDVPDDTKMMDSAGTRYGTSVWHADSSFLAAPPKFTILQANTLPPVGGDTCWASMTAAYDALPEPVRTMLDKLQAVHSIELPMTRLGDYGGQFEDAFKAVHAPQQVHPVVTINPETGKKALFVSECSTTRIIDVPGTISRHLLAMLIEHIRSPDFALRWRWSPGDVAMWDNRTVQHYAVPDYTGGRVMQRIVIKGDRPVGA